MEWLWGVLKAIPLLRALAAGHRRLHVRIISEPYPTTRDPVVVEFEAENRSDKPDSLSHVVTLTGLSAFRHRPCVYTMQVQERDRNLAPYTPRRFHATALADADLSFLWFKKYVFRTGAGLRFAVLTEGAAWPHPIELRASRFYLARFLMRRCGRLIQPSKVNGPEGLLRELKTSRLPAPRDPNGTR